MRAQTEWLLRGLEARGYKLTEQRIAVCEALVIHGGHPNAAEVFALIHDQHPSISLATVYNTLTTLEQLGLIQAMPLATEEHTRYDLDLSPHVNIACQSCGTILDAQSGELAEVLSSVAQSAGVLFESASVIIYGRCPECARRPLGTKALS